MGIVESTYWDKPQDALKLGESTVAELLSTQAAALSPVVKTTHEPNFLSNAEPNNRHLALLQPINLSSLILDNLQKVPRLYAPEYDLKVRHSSAAGSGRP